VFFFFLIKSSVVWSLKFSFAIIIYFDCDCRFLLATNGKVFMKKGEFGTHQPVTCAGFSSKVELLPTAS
jgi:hypothetical protein